MTDTDATRLAGEDTNATQFAGEPYRTRLASSAIADDKTRIAQEGYQSKLTRDGADVQSDISEFYKVGDKIGDRYEVSAIHHGAMGVVYGCFDHETKLPRALKTVRSRHLHDNQVLSLFENEAAVWISLEKHPYIVRAYLVERFNKLPYVITEYVRGPEGMEGDLRGWLGHPRLTLPVAAAMALQIAQGMQHAVRKVPNLVHRDLKPGNILVNGDGKAMVTDFGLVDSEQSGAGTPAYMSPEQWREDVLDARSDIYAYGCILFEMFTGHRLFPALTERDWQSAHIERSPATLTSLVPELPGEIDQYVRRCLEKHVGGRPQNWDEVVMFFASWYHRLTGKAVVFDFSSLELNAAELLTASYSLGNLKRWDEMLLACDRSLAIDQNNAAVWSNKGFALSYLKRYVEAIQACDRAIKIDQNFVAAWLIKGPALSNLKRYEEEIQAYDHALAIDQNDADAWKNKGIALNNLNRYEDAIQAFDRALLIDISDANAWNSKGGVLMVLKRNEEAIQAFDRALDIDKNNAFAWNNKGCVLRETYRFDEAIHAYDQALSIDKHDATRWYNKGLVFHDQNRYEEAILAYDNALAIQDNYLSAWVQKGLAHSYLGQNEDAIKSYDRVLAIDPNDDITWCDKGDALMNLDRYDEANRAYDCSLAISQNDTITWNNKGNALRSQNRFTEAINAYNQALAIDPKNQYAIRGKKQTEDLMSSK
jgi:tetratricopeptide (TPR) repeat protein